MTTVNVYMGGGMDYDGSIIDRKDKTAILKAMIVEEIVAWCSEFGYDYTYYFISTSYDETVTYVTYRLTYDTGEPLSPYEE